MCTQAICIYVPTIQAGHTAQKTVACLKPFVAQPTLSLENLWLNKAEVLLEFDWMKLTQQLNVVVHQLKNVNNSAQCPPHCLTDSWFLRTKLATLLLNTNYYDFKIRAHWILWKATSVREKLSLERIKSESCDAPIRGRSLIFFLGCDFCFDMRNVSWWWKQHMQKHIKVCAFTCYLQHA